MLCAGGLGGMGASGGPGGGRDVPGGLCGDGGPGPGRWRRMIFARSLGSPQAAAEERTLSWEEVQQLFPDSFPDRDRGGKQRAQRGQRLSPVAAAHRILTNSFGLIPFRSVPQGRGGAGPGGGPRPEPCDEGAGQPLYVPLHAAEGHHVQCLLVRLWGRVEPEGAGRTDRGAARPAQRLLHRPEGSGRRGVLVRLQRGRGCSGPSPTMSCPSSTLRPMTGSGAGGCWTWPGRASPWTRWPSGYGKKFYQNGARLSGIVEVDTDASSETRTKVKREFSRFASEGDVRGGGAGPLHEVHAHGAEPEGRPVHREPAVHRGGDQPVHRDPKAHDADGQGEL